MTTQDREFIVSLRRLLYIGQVYRVNADDMRMLEATPVYLKVHFLKIDEAIGRMFHDIKRRVTPAAWELAMQDLTGDEIHDINLMLDAVSNVVNLGEVVDIINQWKTEITKAA